MREDRIRRNKARGQAFKKVSRSKPGLELKRKVQGLGLVGFQMQHTHTGMKERQGTQETSGGPHVLYNPYYPNSWTSVPRK